MANGRLSFVDMVVRLLGQLDPDGQVTRVGYFGSPPTQDEHASLSLWEGAELKFWLHRRPLLGDAAYRQATGDLPEDARSLGEVQKLTGSLSAREFVLVLALETARLLLHKAVSEARDGRDSTSRALVARAQTIAERLNRGASSIKDREDPYIYRAGRISARIESEVTAARVLIDADW